MPTPVSPGIYANELDFSDYIVRGSLTVPCYVGGATRGPVGVPVTVNNLPELQRTFGVATKDDLGLLAAEEFLRSGGGSLMYVRVANSAVAADFTIDGPNTGIAATGSITIDGDPADGSLVTLNDGTNPAVTFEFENVLAALGNIALSGLPNDTDTFVLDDGVNPAVTFEFDGDASVVESPTLRSVAIGATVADTIAAMIVAVNSAPTLDITAAPGTGDSVDLVNDLVGTAGNTAITGTDTATVQTLTGMAGGTDSGVGGGNVAVTVTVGNPVATATALETAIGGAAVDITPVRSGATVTLTVDAVGPQGNNTITELDTANAITVAGLSGGIAIGTPTPAITVAGSTPGSWANGVQVNIAATSALGGDANYFDLSILAPVDASGILQVVETYANVTNDASSDRFVQRVINEGIFGSDAVSQYITIAQDTDQIRPADGLYTLGNAPGTAGADGIAGLTPADYVGTVSGAQATGLKSLRNPERIYFNILAVPGVTDVLVLNEINDLANLRQDFIALIDTPFGLDVDTVIDWHNGEASGIPGAPTAPLVSNFFAIYWAWTEVFSDTLRENVWLPPSAFVAARMAEVDSTVGPWFAVAGRVRGVFGKGEVEYSPSREERDRLIGGSNRINSIVDFIGTGPTVYGNRTAQRAPTALDRIHVRRMVLYVKFVCTRAVQELEFNPNDDLTWTKFEQLCKPHLDNVKAGRGLTDYRIIIDASTNPPELRAQGRMNGKILLQHIDASEIIEMDFALLATGAEFNIPA